LLYTAIVGLPNARRACRHYVSWPGRVRSVSEAGWHASQVVNLSVTGVLLRIDRQYRIGERVEVDIDFLSRPECTTVVSAVGYIVREDRSVPGSAAVHFIIECGLSRRTVSGDRQDSIGLRDPIARDGRL
jgi:hypothetical protein